MLEQLADLHACSYHHLRASGGPDAVAKEHPTLALPGWIPQNTDHMKAVFTGLMGANYRSEQDKRPDYYFINK